MCKLVNAERYLVRRELQGLCGDELVLRFGPPLQLIPLLPPLRPIFPPGRVIRVYAPKEFIGCGLSRRRRQIGTLELLKENVENVEITVAQMDRRALVAVKIDQRRRIVVNAPL